MNEDAWTAAEFTLVEGFQTREHLALVTDSTKLIVCPPVDRHENLVEMAPSMPGGTRGSNDALHGMMKTRHC